MSVDTLLNWTDIGTKAHTSELLTSVAETGCHYALERGRNRRWHVLSSPMRTPGEATEEMEKIATHGSIQKSVMAAMVKKIAMGVSNKRTTNTGNQECHCATEIVN